MGLTEAARTRWLALDRLVVVVGLAAALPVIVATVRAVAAGWLPLGDDALIAVRSYDVLSLHPPLLGPFSVSSLAIGEPVQSPGPLLFWLLAAPVRLGEAAPVVAMGIVNTACVVGVVALARRHGGRVLMFAAAAAVALMCGSLDAATLRDVWGPSAAVIPFTLLIFLAWSLACGEYRLLPLTALVASFVVQAHLTYIVPAVALVAVGVAFLLVPPRPAIPRAWVAVTVGVLAVCWSLPLAEEVVHRPGNMEEIVRVATADDPRFGAGSGWHAVVRAVGVPPWWLRGPRRPFARLADVNLEPSALAIATAVLVLSALAAVAVVALRRRRRELAAAALLALALTLSVGVVTASTPNGGQLFSVISYTLWWASPAGMFCWLAVGMGAGALVRAPRLRASPGLAAAAGAVAVAAVGSLVAARGEPDRLEHAFDPARRIVERVRDAAPADRTTLVTGSRTEVALDLQGAVAYGLRTRGIAFVNSSMPGLGERYDVTRHGHDAVMTVADNTARGSTPARVVARAVLNGVPADALRPEDARHVVVVTLDRARPDSRLTP